MKRLALSALPQALAAVVLITLFGLGGALAQTGSKGPAAAPAPSKARLEAEARMAEELARETMAADIAATARAQTAKEDAARAARVAEALAAPIVSVVPSDPSKASRGAAPATVAASIAPTLAGAAPDAAAAVAALPPAAGVAAPATQGASPPLMAAAASEQKLALVIGNSSYKSSPLTNPVNDARAMAIRLTQLGFTVIKKENAERAEMLAAVRDFGTQLRAGGGVGLFYYAGHGIQSKGVNYLVPVDADIRNEDELSTRAYNANEVLEKMDTAKNRINMVVLDACRDNPFARSFRSGGRGLAGMDQTPSGTLVAYATSPGSTASDGSGANGLYTEQLLRAMSEPGIKLEEVFKRVRVNVMERSEGKQIPWEMSSITGDFYFSPTAEQANMAVAVGGAGGGGARLQQEQTRQLLPVLISRRLIEHYQLTANFPLQGQPSLATFSRSGQAFAIAGKDRTLKTFNTMTGAALATETGYSDAAFGAGRSALVALVEQGRVAVHDVGAELAPRSLEKVPAGALLAALSPNGRRLLIYNNAKGFLLFDMESQALLAQLDSVEGGAHFLFSPNSERLITWGERDSNMKLWDTESGKRITRMSDHWNPVGQVRFSADSSTIFSAAHDDKAVLWRSSNGDSIRKLELGDGNPLPQQMDVFNGGRNVLAYVVRSTKVPGASMQLGVWETTNGRQVGFLLPDGATLTSYFLAQDQGRLFVNASDRNLYVFDLASLQRINVMAGMEFLSLSPDGRRFLVRNGEGVRLMDIQNMAPIGRMAGQLYAFPAPKGNLFATSAADGSVTLWSFENGDQVGQLKGHLDTVLGVVFSDDGRRLVTLGGDNVAKLWALPEIKDMHQLAKDQFESTTEYNKRMVNWSSPYTSLVTLAGYNADAETFNVRFGDITAAVPLDRESAKKLVGQRQAIITAKLKFFDGEQLILSDSKLTRLP